MNRIKNHFEHINNLYIYKIAKQINKKKKEKRKGYFGLKLLYMHISNASSFHLFK
jgi:hypothetical protein